MAKSEKANGKADPKPKKAAAVKEAAPEAKVETPTKETDKKEITTFKGYVNTHEKATDPARTRYDNGNSRYSFNFVYKDAQHKLQDVNVVALNDIADKLYSAMTADGIKGFTLSGRYDEQRKTIYPTQVQLHPIINIEGKIGHVDQKEKYTDIIVNVNNDKLKSSDTFNVRIASDIELNGALLEKGATIAVNGEAAVFSHKDNTRSVSIRPWNIAPNLEKVQEIVAERQRTSTFKQEVGKE